MTSLAPLLMASVVLKDGMPHHQRLDFLRKYFDPPPGQMVSLDPNELRDHGRKVNPAVSPHAIRGRIRVKPPRGQCFLFRGPPDDSDQNICGEKDLVFTVKDMDRSGRLTWSVRTGPEDFGTELSWNTPYRLVILEPSDSLPEDPPEYRFLERCQSDRETVLGRRIRVGLLSGEEWSVRIPEEEELLPQPDPIPNLYIEGQRRRTLENSDANKKAPEHGEQGKEGGHGSPKEASQEAAKNEHGVEGKQSPKDGQGTHASEGGHQSQGHGDPEKKPPESSKAPLDPLEDRKSWSIPMRDSYRLDASLFSTGVPTTRGGAGTCRYTYRGPPDDPDTGRLECHNVPGYRLIYLPLPCFNEVRQPGKPAPKR